LNEKSSGSRSRKQRLTAVGTRCADHVTPLYPQKLALTPPTDGGRSVSIVRVRTKATEFRFSNCTSRVAISCKSVTVIFYYLDQPLHNICILTMNVYIVSTRTRFDALASSSESLIFNLLKLQNQYGYKINKLKCFNLFITSKHVGVFTIKKFTVICMLCTGWSK